MIILKKNKLNRNKDREEIENFRNEFIRKKS